MAEQERTGRAQLNEVVSYADDVYTWVYLDQIDRVLRYEAYVVGYDGFGKQTTLEIVLEEGTLDPFEFNFLRELLKNVGRRTTGTNLSPFRLNMIADRLTGKGECPPFDLYRRLTSDQCRNLHKFFCQQEKRLKRVNRSRWTERLRALGYDVIPSLV